MKKLIFLITLMINAAALFAQAPVKPTAVMVNLTPKAGIAREKIMAILPQEMRETAQAYLDGKIQQWWSKADGTGVVFILNVTSVADAKAVMEALPLDQAGLVDLQYMPLAPLQPMKQLLMTDKK